MINSSNMHMVAIFTSYDRAWGLILIVYLKIRMPINSTRKEMFVY